MTAATLDGVPIGEHDWHSPLYVEAWIARDVTRDAERRQRLRDMLGHAALPPAAASLVLDVGGGYGVVTEVALRALPLARVTLQDYSEPMLAEARRRLAGFGERVRYVPADLFDPAWSERVGGPFDLAVSAIAIHNLREPAAIAACYRGVARVLKAGARFLDYDLFFERTGGLARHLEWLKEAGFDPVEVLWQQPPLAAVAARLR